MTKHLRQTPTQASHPSKSKMCPNIVISNLISLFLFCFSHPASLPYIIMTIVSKPYQRGIYCDDESIMYPLKPDTITHGMLAAVTISCTVIIVSFNRKLFFFLRSVSSRWSSNWLYSLKNILRSLFNQWKHFQNLTTFWCVIRWRHFYIMERKNMNKNGNKIFHFVFSLLRSHPERLIWCTATGFTLIQISTNT